MGLNPADWNRDGDAAALMCKGAVLVQRRQKRLDQEFGDKRCGDDPRRAPQPKEIQNLRWGGPLPAGLEKDWDVHGLQDLFQSFFLFFPRDCNEHPKKNPKFLLFRHTYSSSSSMTISSDSCAEGCGTVLDL